MKTDERITKATDGRRGRAIAIAMMVAVAAYAGYGLYKNRPTSESEIEQIETLVKADRIDDAILRMREAQERSKDKDGLRLRIGRAYLRQGRIGPAAALLSQVEPQLIKEERLAIAEYFVVQGDPFSAARFYESALQAGQERSASLLGRYGEALALSARPEDAVRLFKEALAKDPMRAGTRLNLAITLVNLGRTEEGRTEASLVLKTDPRNEKAIKLLKGLRP